MLAAQVFVIVVSLKKCAYILPDLLKMHSICQGSCCGLSIVLEAEL